MGAGFELRQRLMAARQFVVAIAAIRSGMAGGALHAVERGVLAMQVVLPPRSMVGGQHYLVAVIALRRARRRCRHVLVAHEALGIGSNRFLRMVRAEGFGVEIRLDALGVAERHGRIGHHVVGMAGFAIRHAELGLDGFGRIVALHAIDHLRQRNVLNAGAAGDGVVAGGAVQVELILHLEVRRVVERNIDVLALDFVGAGKLARFREAGILDFFGRMTTAATVCIKLGIERGRHAGFGMAGSALRMAWKSRKDALRIELVAERAIGAEAGFRVDTGLGVDVFRMSELKQDGAAAFIAREGQQIGAWRFLKIGLLIMPPALLGATLLLALTSN